MRRLAATRVAVALLVALGAHAARPARALGQEPPQFIAEHPGRGALTHFNFHLGIESLSGTDPRFQWDTDWGGDVDVIDYGRGRVNVLGNYEGILGNELQPFDPIFNNYTLGLLASVRVHGNDVAALLQHVSVHFSDREKRFGIAWNELGVQMTRRLRSGPWDVQVRGRLMGNVSRFALDYAGEAGGDVAWRRRLRRLLELEGHASLTRQFVDRAVFGRTGQTGGRGEIGVRVPGRAAAFEAYVAAERRIDADKRELVPYRWIVFGVRFVNLD